MNFYIESESDTENDSFIDDRDVDMLTVSGDSECSMESDFDYSVLPSEQFADAYKNMRRESVDGRNSAWLSAFKSIPWKLMKQTPEPLCTLKNRRSFLLQQNALMDSVLYGQKSLKLEMLHMLARYITAPNSKPRAIGLCGRPGTGKTFFTRQYIAKCFNRPFYQISMGGSKDSNILMGMDAGYIGAKYGRIMDAVISLQSWRPVIFIDELDKISQTPEGREIWNSLIHITDPVQSEHFCDNYFRGLPFDLSEAFFVFSFNDISAIDKILLDRIHVIHMDDYTKEDLKIILEKYHLNRIFTEIGIDCNRVSKKMVNDLITRASQQTTLRKGLQFIESVIMAWNYELLVNGKISTPPPMTIL